MDANAATTTAGLVALAIVSLLGIAILILWIVSPFMLYAINQKLLETNRLLSLLLEGQRAQPPAAPPGEPLGEPPGAAMFRSLGH